MQIHVHVGSVIVPLPSEQQRRGGPDDDGRRSGREHCASGLAP